ncbi:hypothetical protein L873DRAFT_1678963 [Choiromyces venosus 120613-1]|uniref:Uncharacterized protein n=1 Tax=Choiromyces venosus 120613-1 TaxID=1336337 RepID=A0A3N4JR47_9PEZI|nr:hypothetical protein L873DRAFT_1678963 [Choiromyces venosus 120613-1]
MELNSREVNEVSYEHAIEKNAILAAERSGLVKEKTKLLKDMELLLHEKTNLETQVTALRNTNQNLYDELCESERLRNAQTEELKQFQTQEYERTRSVVRESHEAISSQFQEMSQKCSNWARDYFKIKMIHFDVKKFPEFEEQLKLVSWDKSNWDSKALFNASHLVQAVLGNMVYDFMFSSPFCGTEGRFHDQFQDMYKIKCYNDKAEAQRWRASSLQTYYSCKRWPLDSQLSRPIEYYKAVYVNHVSEEIEKVLKPITDFYYPGLSDKELNSRREGLLSIVKYAKALSEKMSKQSSELQVLAKPWFNQNNRCFNPNDDRMKSRLGDDDYSSQDDLKVDLILFPGFLKYGNDNAENLDVWNVWTPAIVEIDRPLPPITSRPPIVPVRTPPKPSLRDCGELPEERQKQEAELLDKTTEQEHSEDEEFQNIPYPDLNPWF